jgi:hypothetical protein
VTRKADRTYITLIRSFAIAVKLLARLGRETSLRASVDDLICYHRAGKTMGEPAALVGAEFFASEMSDKSIRLLEKVMFPER